MSDDSSQGSLFKRTILTTLAMVGACVLLVGVLSFTAVTVVSRAVQPAPAGADGTPALVPVEKIDGKPSQALPKPPTKSNQI
jgi:hypothetical protein